MKMINSCFGVAFLLESISKNNSTRNNKISLNIQSKIVHRKSSLI